MVSDGGVNLHPYIPAADFGVCANVLLSPEPAFASRVIANVSRALAPGAALLVVVPSTEVGRRQA